MTTTPLGPALVVTVVHGTVPFARWPHVLRILNSLRLLWSHGSAERNWYEEGSEFVKNLAELLGDRAKITRFLWSGGNTAWHRLCAAGAEGDFGKRFSRGADAERSSITLREHIATIARDYPATRQVLVAHSHGGNVCLSALRDQRTRRVVSGLVCLSTPFVHARKRADSKVLGDMVWLLLALLYLMFFVVSSHWIFARVPDSWDSTVRTIGLSGLLSVLMLLWTRREARRHTLQAWAESSVGQPQIEGLRTLVVLSDGDEALLALKVAEGLSVMTRALWRLAFWLPHRVMRTVHQWGKRRVVVYGLMSFLSLGVLLFIDTQSPWGPNSQQSWTPDLVVKFLGAAAIAPGLLFLTLMLSLAMPAFGALLLGVPALLFFRWLAFGWGGSIGLDMTAETCPVGTATVVRLGSAPNALGLRHAHSYNHERAPHLVAEFIAGIVGTGNSESAGRSHETR